MKLTVFVDQNFYRDGDAYSTDDAFFLFVDSFRIYFEKIIFIGRCAEGKKCYLLDPQRHEVIEIPYYGSVYEAWKAMLSIYRFLTKVLCARSREFDVMWICGPHPVSIVLAHLCRRFDMPYFLMVRQNLAGQVRYRTKGIMKIISLAVVAFLELLFRRIARDHFTFTVGNEMYKKYKRPSFPVHKIFIPLIRYSDIMSSRREPIINRPLRLLSVGRLDPEKGLFTLLDAFKMLRDRGCNVKLTIVGTGFEEENLKKYAFATGISDLVDFKGYVKYGPELFDIYKSSDIFVLPSLPGEGFPQVLLEAMAFGVSVVATRVEGIPDVITHRHNGMIVNAESAAEIAEAVTVLSDGAFRDRIISEAYKTAEHLTIESQRDFLFNTIGVLLQ